MLTIAHVGHWAVNLLYIAPLLIGLGLLGYQLMQSKRAVNHERTHARRRPSPRRPP